MVRFLSVLAVIVVSLAAMGVSALAAAKRLRTGSWSLPDRSDYAWIGRAVRKDSEPPRVIYLNREAQTIIGGLEYSHESRSQLVPLGESRPMPGFTGSRRSWSRIVACVKKKFAPFAVEITDKRPTTPGYVMVQVGGSPRDLYDHPKRNVGGVAPFHGDVISDAVVFVFSSTLRNQVNSVCETIAHEVGHIYGLDHAYHRCDLMTYLTGCTNKRFVHDNVRCGETRRRDCGGGETQDSYARLLAVLGPRETQSPAAPVQRTAVARR